MDSHRFVYLHASPILKTEPRKDGTFEYLPVDLLDVKSEKAMLLDCFERYTSVPVQWFDVPVTVNTFVTALQGGCTILHYTGHGTRAGELCFEDDTLLMHRVPVADLKHSYISTHADVKLVFVSACHSALVARHFEELGVAHVIACQSQVLDDASRNFARMFYTALLLGKSVQEAFDSAVAANAGHADLAVAAEASKFVLCGSALSHHERLFPGGLPPNRTLFRRSNPVNDSFVHGLDQFVGRESDVHLLYKDITSPDARVICVRGKPGIGKTELVKKTASLIGERSLINLFRACWYVSLSHPAQTPLQAIASEFGLPSELGTLQWKLREAGRALLVLDDADTPHLSPGDLDALVKSLLMHCGELRIVLVVVRPPTLHVPRKDRVITGVLSYDAARIFLKLSPRPLKEIDYKVSGNEAVALFSKTALISCLDGHPALIRKVSSCLIDVPDLLSVSHDLLKTCIPAWKREVYGSSSCAEPAELALADHCLRVGLPASLLLLFGDDAAAYIWSLSMVSQASVNKLEFLPSLPPEEFEQYLCWDDDVIRPQLEEVLHQQLPFLATVRQLREEDYHMLMHGDWIRERNLLFDNTWMRADKFVFWWRQVKVWISTLQHAESDWCNRDVVLYGFLKDYEVQAIMTGASPGAYLFRMSNSEIGKFAVTFMKPDGKLEKALIEATHPGVYYVSEAGNKHMFDSLVDLAQANSALFTHNCVNAAVHPVEFLG